MAPLRAGKAASSHTRLRPTSGCLPQPTRLADRHLLLKPFRPRLDDRVCLESWIRGKELNDLFAYLVDELGLLQRIHGGIGQAMLPRAHQLPDAPPPHVLACQHETVVNSRHELEPLLRGIGG